MRRVSRVRPTSMCSSPPGLPGVLSPLNSATLGSSGGAALPAAGASRPPSIRVRVARSALRGADVAEGVLDIGFRAHAYEVMAAEVGHPGDAVAKRERRRPCGGFRGLPR